MIIPGFNYIAVGEVIVPLGAKPVYVDMESDSFNVDPSGLEAAITSRTRAIVGVSRFGQCADFDWINEIGDNYGIVIIEDAAQSFGTMLGKRKSCALSRIACTSFFPTKPLGCYDDGGAVSTDDKVREELTRRGVPTAVHYPLPLYKQPVLMDDVELPIFDKACAEVLSLPMHPYLSEEDQRHISSVINEIFERKE